VAVRVACIGDNCIDRYLRPIQQMHVGGNAVNVAVGLARHGLRVTYAGAVGADADGRAVLGALAAAGIDTVHVEIWPGHETGVTLVELTPDGDRVFLEERLGTSGIYEPPQSTLEAIVRCAWVHAAGLHADPHVLSRLRGVPISYDFSQQHRRELVAELAKHLEIAFFSGARQGRDEAVAIAREAVAAGARSAVVTLGREGSLGFDGELVERPAPPAEVVDTLGAGDALIAGVIAARLDGAGLADALDAGGRAAARTCGHYGAWRAA
jgi:fructoselysine 6-kinase